MSTAPDPPHRVFLTGMLFVLTGGLIDLTTRFTATLASTAILGDLLIPRPTSTTLFLGAVLCFATSHAIGERLYITRDCVIDRLDTGGLAVSVAVVSGTALLLYSRLVAGTTISGDLLAVGASLYLTLFLIGRYRFRLFTASEE